MAWTQWGETARILSRKVGSRSEPRASLNAWKRYVAQEGHWRGDRIGDRVGNVEGITYVAGRSLVGDAGSVARKYYAGPNADLSKIGAYSLQTSTHGSSGKLKLSSGVFHPSPPICFARFCSRVAGVDAGTAFVSSDASADTRLLHSLSVHPSAPAAATSISHHPSRHIEARKKLDSCPLPQYQASTELQTENGQILYSGMTSRELFATLLNLSLVAYEPIVNLSLTVLNSPLMKAPVLSAPIMWSVRQTAYSHFCAGANVSEASATLSRMWELGLRGVLDYSLEDAVDNESCDKNLAGFLNTIQQTPSLPPGSVSFACVKISAICPTQLLERVSALLRWQHRDTGFRLPWKEDGLSILAVESPMYHVREMPIQLSPEEEQDLLSAQKRFRTLCKACEAGSLPMLVDAEYSSVQPAIDYLTYSAALEFNKGGQLLIYGTIQTYLKDAFPRLSLALKEATSRGVTLGIKLVRGAYITREKAEAAALGASSPVHSKIEETHQCYDACAALMLSKVASENFGVMLATHNTNSGKAAAQLAQELGLDRRDQRVQFAQLKGMADGLSLALVHAGFHVSKYLPFGPVEQVIPYLIRRAEENRGLLGNTLADRKLIRQELWRRLVDASGFQSVVR